MRLTIEMISDWHCGSGNERRGDMDRLVARDADGLPYIPGKTIKGVWRDACELAAAALDGGESGTKWADLVLHLFGAQPSVKKGSTVTNPGCLVVSNARFPKGLAKALANDKLRGSVTFGKPGVAICRETGTAKDQTLRITEMARAGCRLDCNVDFDPPLHESVKDACEQLLLAGAMLVDDLGGKRNRGAGRCKFLVNGVDWKPDVLKKQPNAVPAPTTSDPTTSEVPTPGSGRVSPKKRKLVTMVLETRVVIPEKVLGNVVRCRDTIPGGMILAALAKNNKDMWKWVHSGNVRVTDATPVAKGESKPGRPVPFSFHTKKDDPDTSYHNFLMDVPPVENEQPQYKGSRGDFVGELVDGVVSQGKARQTHKTHSVVDDQVGRPTEEVGGVYTYMALAPGQTYAFYVDYDQGEKVEIPNAIRLGSSKNVEYGLCTLVAGDEEDLNPVSLVKEGEAFNLWLLSDALLYDEQLRPNPTEAGLKAALEDALGVQVEIERAFLRQSRREGWHSGWGLAQPSLPCLAAGSVAKVKVLGKVEDGRVQALVHGGLGDRTAEGMGMVSINDPLLAESNVALPPSSRDDRNPYPIEFAGARDSEEEKYLCLVEREACRKLIRDSALARAGGPGAQSYRGAPKAQLGSVRSAFRRLTGPGTIESWFTHLANVSNRRQKWSDEAWTKWKALATIPNEVWKDLGLEDADRLPCRAKRAVALKNELWLEAVLSWVDALAKASRTQKGSNQNGGEPN